MDELALRNESEPNGSEPNGSEPKIAIIANLCLLIRTVLLSIFGLTLSFLPLFSKVKTC